MAIQVGGTTVINNSRTLQNVGGLKTVGGTSILGSGNIATGGSTTAYDVGTYLFGRHSFVSGEKVVGSTTAGSNLEPATAGGTTEGASPSGTWRTMGYALTGSSGGAVRTTVWVRIS